MHRIHFGYFPGRPVTDYSGGQQYDQCSADNQCAAVNRVHGFGNGKTVISRRCAQRDSCPGQPYEQRYAVNCPDYGVKPVAYIVHDGICNIFRAIQDAYGIEHGGIATEQALEFDGIEERLADFMERYTKHATGESNV